MNRTQKRVIEVSSGQSASGSVSWDVSTIEGSAKKEYVTTDGVILVDVGTTEGDRFMDPSGSGKLDPPAC